MAQIARTGVLTFSDASLSVWEEGLSGTWDERQAWERLFKKQVFARIVQTLNRLGWTLAIPEDHIKRYGKSFAEKFRYCVKGDLKGDLDLSGRCIEFKMFQNVNAPDRPDHNGRYQSEKEDHMPYVMRLEMERTRRKIRDYLCNVFSGYSFKADRFDGRTNKCGPGHLNNMEWLKGGYETSSHFKGDTSTYKISDYNNASANGDKLEHGQRVWFFDRKGRINSGIAYYNNNNMWWVLWGMYGKTNLASFKLFTAMPEDYRRKRNDKLREERLHKLMSEAVSRLDFEEATLYRNLLKLEKTTT